jgi:hypothetical protein
MMSDNIARNMLSSQKKKWTQLHLVGHFCEICIMMHGTVNVKFRNATQANGDLLVYRMSGRK